MAMRLRLRTWTEMLTSTAWMRIYSLKVDVSYVQAKSKQAMKQVLGIRDEKMRMKVTPPLAVAPITQEGDMRWNPNDDGIDFNP